MADLATFQLSDMVSLGAAIRRIPASASSMEGAATKIVARLNDTLRTGGAPSCALVRTYKTHRFDGLPGEVREAAERALGGPAPKGMRCLVLLSTCGEEPAWNHRTRSAGHQAIPLPDATFIAKLPMVSEVFRQFGVAAEAVASPDPSALRALGSTELGVFLVEQAEGSPFIPAQDFVASHHVRSVLAFGGVFPDGELFATLLFSHTPVSRASADLFGPLSLNVKSAMLPFYDKPPFG